MTDVTLTVLHSGNDWQARNDLRNLQVSASSITNRPEWRSGAVVNDRGRLVSSGAADPEGKVAAYQAAMGADIAARNAQPGLAAAAMRENAALQRTGMEQQGANQRSLAQAALEQQKINQAGVTQGIANRGKTMVQALQEQIATEPDQTKRQSIVQRLREMQGGQTADPYLVVPGGQHIDPTTQRAYNTPASVFNRQTGQFMQQPGQGGAQAPQTPLSNPSTRPVGTVSTVGGKSATWDGQKWVPRG